MTDRLPLNDDLLARMLERRSARGDATGLASATRAAVEATSQRVGGPKAFSTATLGEPFGSIRRVRMAAYAAVAVAAAAVVVVVLAGPRLLPGIVPGGVVPTSAPTPTERPTPTPEPIDRSYREVGFIGLPPPGAVPSDPARTDLVEGFWNASTPTGGGYHGASFVYADGRMIWNEYWPWPYNSETSSTGWLEQRLTSEGIELVRGVAVDRGTAFAAPDVPRWLDPALLPDLLPVNAWADRTVRPYVPSRFAACVLAPGPGSEGDDPDVTLAEKVALLPEAAGVILSGKPQVSSTTYVNSAGEPADCLVMTTSEARQLDVALRDAGLEQDEVRNLYLLEYHIDLDGAGPETKWLEVWFEPILPDGAITCSSCG